jgi:MbtH protein
MSGAAETTDRHLVLVNEEGQYSLWPAAKDIPAGWRECMLGSKAECLAYVETVWTDMRPASLRRKMGEPGG